MAIKANVSINGFDMSYARFGSGEKVFVILPGLSAVKVTPNAAAVERAYAPIAESFTVYLFDRRDNMPAGYKIHDMAEDTAAVMRHLGIEKACLCGASQGGMIAMDMAINRPELVSGLVLCSAAPYLNDDLKNALETWAEYAKRADSPALNADFVRRLYSEKLLEKNGDVLISAMPTYSEHELSQFLTAIDSFSPFDLRPELHRISCPVFVAGAAHDIVMGPDSSEELAAQLGCEYYIYPDYAHAVYDEAPDFTKRIAEQLKTMDL